MYAAPRGRAPTEGAIDIAVLVPNERIRNPSHIAGEWALSKSHGQQVSSRGFIACHANSCVHPLVRPHKATLSKPLARHHFS